MEAKKDNIKKDMWEHLQKLQELWKKLDITKIFNNI